jgi:hypothetical protein
MAECRNLRRTVELGSHYWVGYLLDQRVASSYMYLKKVVTPCLGVILKTEWIARKDVMTSVQKQMQNVSRGERFGFAD